MSNSDWTSRVTLTAPGEFVLGCNYWASHGGTAMWSDWRPEVVEEDLKLLRAQGLRLLRVFPLWSDFQPLTLLRGGGGAPVEYRHGEAPLPDTDAGRAGLSREALDRFKTFADLAEKCSLKLVVGLVTGWMSGRLFVPPALEDRNVLTDPTAVMWQVRFVRHFVRAFKNHAAIAAWDLGNECNCMGAVASSEQAWVWTSSIANAIRAEDAARPIVSGMHGLSPASDANWRIQDQGELTDVLTTHPYPIFTPHCDRDPINTIRNCLHATAESRYYADIGGRPCLCEEIGTIGPMICSEQIAADYIRTVLFSLWAHDCGGMLWWCGFDQEHLEHAPYDWCPVERELGLIRADKTAKPAAAEIARFDAFLDKLPVATLPPRTAEAVCILTSGQEQWAAAFAGFILAKQAGFDIVFQYADQPLKDAPLYLLPSVAGHKSFTRRLWYALEAKVREGATLYLSHEDCLLSPFAKPFGLKVRTRERRVGDAEIRLSHLAGKPAVTARSPFKLHLEPAGAEVLGREPDGNPAFTRNAFGEGAMYFLSVPIETALANAPSAFHGPDAQPFWKIYRQIAEPHLHDRVVTKDHPCLGVTEHPMSGNERAIVMINYSPDALEAEFELKAPWTPAGAWYGALPHSDESGCKCSVAANDAVVFTAEKK